MAGEFDVYQLCPCGSGKKLKFCCHAIIGEMLKIGELQEHHQFQMALAALESLEKKDVKEVWSRAWIKTTKALVLSALKNEDDARRLVHEVLEQLPEYPNAAILNGLFTLTAEGYPAAKRAISTALRINDGRPSPLLSKLASLTAMYLAAQGHSLASYEHSALAIMLDPNSDDAAKMCLEFERMTSIPYPLRSSYALAPFTGDDSLLPRYAEAAALAAIGCFSDAAKAFGTIARQSPNQPGVWWNIALCHAWAGEDPLACQAFKAAAANQTDPEMAADCLLLARLHDVPTGAERVDRLRQEYRVPSVGKLLTLLDQQPLFARGAIDPEDHEGDDAKDRPAAWYQVLDRDPQSVRTEDLTADSVPRIEGQLVVYDGKPGTDEPPRAFVGALGPDRLNRLKQKFEAIAGTEAEATGEPAVAGFMRADQAALDLSWRLPPDARRRTVESLERARWDRVVQELWPNAAHALLGGKTPLEASHDPSLGSALRAAVLALDVYCEVSGYLLDQAEVLSRLGLPPAALLDVAPDGDVTKLSTLQLRRVPLDRLTDEQLVRIANRISRIGHLSLTYRAVQAVLSRPELTAKVDVSQLYMTLAKISRHKFRSEETLEWIAKGREAAKAGRKPLESLVMWELDELLLRSGDPDDPRVPELADTLWNYYRPKLPEAADFIVGVLNRLELPGPWNAGATGAGEPEPLAVAAAGGGLWTPETQTPAGQPGSLWLPGQ